MCKNVISAIGGEEGEAARLSRSGPRQQREELRAKRDMPNALRCEVLYKGIGWREENYSLDLLSQGISHFLITIYH